MSAAPVQVLSAQEQAIAEGRKTLHGGLSERIVRKHEAVRSKRDPIIGLSRALLLASALFALPVILGVGPVSLAAAPQASTSRPNETITEQDARTIATEAYIYLYPLVSMDVTRRVSTNIEPGKKPGLGPQGAFSHLREYPSVEFRQVVRPNFDTLYSIAWFDVSKDPVILSVPDTNGRYYVLPIYDMWTDAYVAIGKRTSGTGAHRYGIVFRGWNGTLPPGIERIESPTSFGWIIVRTQTNGPKDYDAVRKIQDGYTLTALSNWGKNVTPPAVKIDPSIDMKTAPLDQVNAMPGPKFFSYAAELMKANPPHPTDWSIVTRMKRIGLVPGRSFSENIADPNIRQAVEQAPAAGLQLMNAKLPTLARVVNGWQMNTDSMGVYGNYYLKRAIVTLVGLGANNPEDAVYPLNISDADGQPVDGANRYVMHFSKAELPPVEAFWSITMYDAQGFQSANPINRYAVGDRDNLKYNADGSLDIYIQHDNPGTDKVSNWLPAPEGRLGITMRLYSPRAEVIDGRWNPPGIKKVS